MRHTVIQIEALAPPKPAPGAPCNGCGVCCLVEPCPLGMLLTGRRSGACTALRWDAERERYVCGAVQAPEAIWRQKLPPWMHGAAPWFARPLRRMALRWIAAGRGCDSTLEQVVSPDKATP